jgi:hypothetical protein
MHMIRKGQLQPMGEMHGPPRKFATEPDLERMGSSIKMG